MRKHVLIGMAAAVLLVAGYVGVIALAQGWAHALEQAGQMWYWLLALASGFGIQAGLFSFIRQGLHNHKHATTSLASSGGVSAGSMAACCAHHLSDVLPLLGLSGAALFVVRYQEFFLIAGVLSNVAGIILMLETIQRHGLSQRLTKWRWNIGRIRKGAMLSFALASRKRS